MNNRHLSDALYFVQNARISSLLREGFFLLSIVLPVLFLSLSTTFASTAYASEPFRYEEVEDKRYDFIQNYKIHHRTYKHGPVNTIFETPLTSNRGPDQQVINLISSVKRENFEWWSSNFSRNTLAQWDQQQILDKSGKEYKKWLKRMDRMESLQFKHWYGVRDVIFVGFDIQYEQESKKDPVYVLLPIILEQGVWRVDQGYMRSALYVRLLERN